MMTAEQFIERESGLMGRDCVLNGISRDKIGPHNVAFLTYTISAIGFGAGPSDDPVPLGRLRRRHSRGERYRGNLLGGRPMSDDYGRIVAASDDLELPFIEAAAERAGIIWRCDCGWINRPPDRHCGDCGANHLLGGSNER